MRWTLTIALASMDECVTCSTPIWWQHRMRRQRWYLARPSLSLLHSAAAKPAGNKNESMPQTPSFDIQAYAILDRPASLKRLPSCFVVSVLEAFHLTVQVHHAIWRRVLSGLKGGKSTLTGACCRLSCLSPPRSRAAHAPGPASGSMPTTQFTIAQAYCYLTNNTTLALWTSGMLHGK